jgi:hypothetical protein
MYFSHLLSENTVLTFHSLLRLTRCQNGTIFDFIRSIEVTYKVCTYEKHESLPDMDPGAGIDGNRL